MPQARTVALDTGATLAYDRLVLAPGIDIRWDGPARLRRGGRREDAARLEGRRADAAAAPPARGHGGRRRGRHVGAGQSVPLPARPLRARQPDRQLSQDQEAEVEADRARRQGRVLQAAAVPERLEGALSRSPRMGGAVQGRQGHLGRCRRDDARHRFRQAQGGRRQRHPAAEGRPHRRARRRRRRAPAGARSIR